MTETDEQVVLVVTGQDDLFCDKIVLSLESRNVDVVRLDLSATPLRMDCAFSDGRWHGTIQTGNGRLAHIDKVTSVLWRWSRKIPGNPDITDLDQRAWAAQEDTEAVLGVLRSLPAFWMSHPDRLAAVEGNKPTQLRDAAQAGLPVPPTLIATQGASVDAWARHDRAHVYKAFRAPYRPARGDAGWVLATRLQSPPPEQLSAASIFQEMIDGTPIRVTAIGDQTFAAAITGITYDIDWRPQQTEATLKPVAIPPKTRRAINTLMHRWGLNYGTFDFISTGDDWVFLEINPSGAYGFVEEGTGLPLTKTITDTLLRGRPCPS